MRKFATGFVLSSAILFSNTVPHSYASAETTQYKIQIGEFLGQMSAKDALQRLQKETGWNLTLEPTTKKAPYYRLYSGYITLEVDAQQAQNELRQLGYQVTVEPIRIVKTSEQIISGVYLGKEDASTNAKEFTAKTGIPAGVQENSKIAYKKRLTSTEYMSDQTAKQLTQDITKKTGLSATVKKTGKSLEVVKIVSGSFAGESTAKKVLRSFQETTGMKATIKPITYTRVYQLTMNHVSGKKNVENRVKDLQKHFKVSAMYEKTKNKDVYNVKVKSLSGSNLTKVEAYVKSKKWRYAKTKTGQLATHFCIESSEQTDQTKINKGLKYFKDKKWNANAKKTGKKITQYTILSESTFDQYKLNQAGSLFKGKSIDTKIETTKEKGTPYFDIVTDPIQDEEKLRIATNFFKTKKLAYYTANVNSNKQTFYQITVDNLLGENKDKVEAYFKKKRWAYTESKTVKTEQYYTVVTSAFDSKEVAEQGQREVEGHYGFQSELITEKLGQDLNTSKESTSDSGGKTENSTKQEFPSTSEPLNNSEQESPSTVKNPNAGEQEMSSAQTMVKNSMYNITLTDALNMQMAATPQTDKYRNQPAYVSSKYIKLDGQMGTVTADSLPIYAAQSTTSHMYGQLKKGTQVKIVETGKDWYKIALGDWRNASVSDVKFYLDPQNFMNDEKQKFQFLDLSKTSGITVNQLNNVLQGMGILSGQGQAFIDAGKLYGMNELYLISHALLETGKGTSPLATGIKYEGKTVYNMYGIGAFDNDPDHLGAKTAYSYGWDSPYKAIVGGARFIANGYIDGNNKQQMIQNTIYKMRWNPEGMARYGSATHQYATDIGWAYKQINTIYDLYKLVNIKPSRLDIPIYK
ncbi:glucosaminidase domain-containing protein [Bacillus andreraoultii]|uniref:glucosaminidase domain-containing protein n=1 Tax=Bacillus andreraoultii TaxID=1499685 RepID=UPI00053A294A|nr:glucosaminidase domain-containing protein [Bacillus andreraoultii]